MDLQWVRTNTDHSCSLPCTVCYGSQFKAEQQEIYSSLPATLYCNSSSILLIDEKRRIAFYSQQFTSPQPSVACLQIYLTSQSLDQVASIRPQLALSLQSGTALYSLSLQSHFCTSCFTSLCSTGCV